MITQKEPKQSYLPSNQSNSLHITRSNQQIQAANEINSIKNKNEIRKTLPSVNTSRVNMMIKKKKYLQIGSNIRGKNKYRKSTLLHDSDEHELQGQQNNEVGENEELIELESQAEDERGEIVSKSSENNDQTMEKQIQTVRMENKKLRNINKDLKKQLLQFDRRLDESIRKQKSDKKMMKIGQEIVENMELQNAYKLMEIYKKQIAKMKKQRKENTNERFDELENMNYELRCQKQQLLIEIRDLKNVVKQQQKGLKQMGAPNGINLIQENKRLQQSIRRIQNLYNFHKNEKSSSEDGQKKRQTQTRLNKNSNSNSNQKIQITMKSEKHRIQTHFSEDKNNSEIQVEKLKKKIMIANKKISSLMAENSGLIEAVEELKQQLADKDREMVILREQLGGFRRKKQRSETKRMSEQNLSPKRPQIIIQNSQQKQKYSQKGKKKQREQTKGESKPGSTKWNHKQMSSKIRQIRVYPHKDGHVKEINFRYDKGEGLPLSRGECAIFSTDVGSGEFIKSVKGGFKFDLLRFIVVETNLGRKAHFCQFQLQDECDNFEFRGQKNQYLGAFFGENCSNGVCRIGCLIESNF